jgi:hypothetical protein
MHFIPALESRPMTVELPFVPFRASCEALFFGSELQKSERGGIRFLGGKVQLLETHSRQTLPEIPEEVKLRWAAAAAFFRPPCANDGENKS